MPTSILALAVDVMLSISLLTVTVTSGLALFCMLIIVRFPPDEYI